MIEPHYTTVAPEFMLINLKSYGPNLEFLVKQVEIYRDLFEDEFIGATIQDVLTIEEQMGLVFPKVFREYLLMMGRQASDVFCGSDATLSCFREMKSYSRDMMLKEGVALPQNALVFFLHQGYSLLYFVCDDQPDPEVYFYMEGDDEVVHRKEYGSFTEFLCREFDQFVKLKLYRKDLISIDDVRNSPQLITKQ